MNLDEYDTTKRFQATVRESRRITPPDAAAEVRHILLSIPDGHLSYQVGESIGVITPGPHPFGNREHLRLYSIADALWERGGHAVDIALCLMLSCPAGWFRRSIRPR